MTLAGVAMNPGSNGPPVVRPSDPERPVASWTVPAPPPARRAGARWPAPTSVPMSAMPMRVVRPWTASSRTALRPRETGSVTLALLPMCLVLLLFSVAAIDVGAVVASRAMAQTAADLAALAALVPADRLPRQAAAAVAEANGAHLTECGCDTGSAVVTVERAIRLPVLGRVVRVPARARAIVPIEPLFPPDSLPRHASDATPGGPHRGLPAGRRATARTLLANPRLTLTAQARADLARGVVDERLIALLGEITRRHRVAVSVFRTGHSRYVAGTRVVSKHTYGRAADIYMVDGGLVRPGHGPSLRLVSWLASLGRPLRPSEVGSPFPSFSPLPGHFSDRAHVDHVHVAVG